MNLALVDAKCQVEQAQRLLSVWMQADISDDTTTDMIGALMTLLRGVADSIGTAHSMVEAQQESVKCEGEL